MNHSFNTDIAKQYDINCAILLQNIYYWVDENKKKSSEKHFHNGRYWTYNTVKQFAEQFPYMNERQIRYTLAKLESNGLIIIGNFNTSCIRTLWYTITDKALKILTNDEDCQEDISCHEKPQKSSEDTLKENTSENSDEEQVTKMPIRIYKIVNTKLQICQYVMTKLSIHTNNKPQIQTTNELEKEIYKEKEPPERQIYDFWNSKNLPQCAELDNYIKTVISTALKSFTLEDIKLYITRYDEVLNSDFYITHQWTLKSFISKSNAMKDFTDNGEKWLNYQHWKEHHKSTDSRDSFIHNNYTKEQISNFVSNLDEIEL